MTRRNPAPPAAASAVHEALVPAACRPCVPRPAPGPSRPWRLQTAPPGSPRSAPVPVSVSVSVSAGPAVGGGAGADVGVGATGASTSGCIGATAGHVGALSVSNPVDSTQSISLPQKARLICGRPGPVSGALKRTTPGRGDKHRRFFRMLSVCAGAGWYLRTRIQMEESVMALFR